uniref:Uncharacterized protein n=1 Tax=Monodon monoceros TaxID=40151 RepID=A0A8C6AVH1_MONMO
MAAGPAPKQDASKQRTRRRRADGYATSSGPPNVTRRIRWAGLSALFLVAADWPRSGPCRLPYSR